MTVGAPAAGLRVKQTVPDYSATAAYHTLYLPKDWQPGNIYPVMVEYTGNNFYVGPDEINSSGNVEDASLGYGITGGTGYIWISMPTVGGSPLANQNTWWGDKATTKDYCKKAVRYVCDNYGGDPAAVVLCGFSRGAIACNYLGLDDDSMADIWLAFMPHAHYDGQYTNWPYADADQASAKARLQRLGGRLQFISEEIALDSPKSYLQGTGVSMAPFTFTVLPFINHTDLWTLRPVDLRASARTWLQNVVLNRPGTHAIKGTVTNAAGQPIVGARIQSGYTHFTFTNASGVYALPGLVNSSRTVSVSATGYTFTDQTVSVAGADVTQVNFVGAVAP
jgi:hypothetical protein